MMVIDPHEYEVKLTDKDMEALESAKKFFNSLHNEMVKRKCTTAQGGYGVKPVQWSAEQIYNVYLLLLEIKSEGIYKIF